MNTSELPVDKWLVVKYRASEISTLVTTHASREEAEARRDKLNKDLATAHAFWWSRSRKGSLTRDVHDARFTVKQTLHDKYEYGRRAMKQPGLDERHRDKDGEISRKKSNTLVRTLRKEYGEDFAKGYRPDAKLATVLKKEDAELLHELLKRKR